MPAKVKDQDEIPTEPPTSIDPYEVLSVSEDATDDQIKKAYRKAALKHHPDKATGEDIKTAKEDFQKIAFAYAILSDPRRRKRYDATGSTAESLEVGDGDFDWQQYFREAFREITKEDVVQFADMYKKSDEEKEHILKAYTKGKGDMDAVYEIVMTSDVLEDDDRFRGIIDEAIAAGEVEAFKKYTDETDKSKERRFKRAKREAKEAEEELAKIEKQNAAKSKKGNSKKDNDDGSLMALIQQRQKPRASMFDHLEEKYGKDTKAGSKKRSAMEEPPEEAFAVTAERFKKNKTRK